MKSETVSVENPTDVAWSLKPSISHDAWYGDELLNIPAKSKGTYTIWYKPLTMTKDTPHKGYVFFPLPDGSAVTFGLVGNASEPAPLSDTIERSFAAKEPHTESLQVTNWLKTTQRFTVTVERPDEPSTFISYNETFDVSGMQTKEYKMTFNAFKEGTTELKVTFTNPKTGEYVFYELQYTAESAKVLASIPMETRVREPMSHAITLENPLDQTVTLTSTCASEVVSVPAELQLAPRSDAVCNITYSPLLAEETPDARLTFTGEELGDFCYDLQLKALPAGMEKPDLHFKTPLGSSQAQTFRFTSFLQGKGTDFKCTISDKANFEVEPVVKAEAAPDANGVEVSVELVFSPSSVGEFPCELVVESADAGKYQVAMYGHSIAPQPQGPHSIKAGGSAKIEFQNVFDEQKQFNFVCDNPAFTCKAGESIAAKKKTTIDVAFKPVAEGDEPLPKVIHASLYVQIVGSELSAWKFYLEGLTE